ncbi:hypothetical protein ABIF13_002687 [Bradyrhizobium elkanii]
MVQYENTVATQAPTAVGGRRQQQRLHHGRLVQPQDRQRHEQPDQHGDQRDLPVVRIGDRTGPGEFRLAVGIEDAPVGSDAAFEELPGLIDRLDDVVVHADGFGAGDEVAQHGGLLERAGNCAAQIVALARPAEFGDQDAFAGEGVAQQIVAVDRLVHRLLVGEVFPVGQHVRGDEVGRVGELRMVAPDVPDFTGGDGNVDRLLDPLDQLDQPVHVVFGDGPLDRFSALAQAAAAVFIRLHFRVVKALRFLAKNPLGLLGRHADLRNRAKVFQRHLFTAEHGFVADHDADDVAVALGQVDRGFDLAVVAVGVLVDPRADRDLHAELGGDRRHQLVAFRRRIEADSFGERGQFSQVGAHLLGVGGNVGDGVA